MGEGIYLDTILVPLSLFITIVYHAFLCYTIKNKPSRTTYGIDKLRRTAWGLNVNQVVIACYCMFCFNFKKVRQKVMCKIDRDMFVCSLVELTVSRIDFNLKLEFEVFFLYS